MVSAWYMDENKESLKKPHKGGDSVSLEKLNKLQVEYIKVNPDNYSVELQNIRNERGYNFSDQITIHKDAFPNYEEKLSILSTEHLHADDEIRYCVEGCGYFDVRDENDKWIRVLIEKGDLLIFPAGIYHRYCQHENKAAMASSGSVPYTHFIGGHKFVNILKDVESASDWNWAFWEERKFVRPEGGGHRDPKAIVEEVLKSERVRKAIETCKVSNEWSQDAAEMEARKLVTQMAHAFSLNCVRMVGYPITKVFQTIFTAIYTNPQQVNHLRELSRKYAIVLMPTHKTYMDFLLITYLCFHLQLTLPAIAAGMDFLSMHTIGEILRKCGAFFIRRSFGQDQLYWAIFTEYVQTHLRHKDRPVEFFLEGTRSRTGKSLHPKFGLLTTLIEPYFRSQVYDLALVPISITYGRILEETLYPYELLGFPKPAESTSGLVKARAILNQNFGDIFVNFGNPISVREYFNGNIERSLHALEPDSQFRLVERERQAVVQMAHDIIQVQQDNLIVTVWPLVCAVFNQLVVQGPHGQMSVMYDQLCNNVQILFDLVQKLGSEEKIVLHFDSVLEDIRYYLSVHDNIVHVQWDAEYTRRQVTLKPVVNPVATHKTDSPTTGKSQLTNDVIEQAVPRLIMSNYGNMCIHLVMRQAYVCTCLLACAPVTADSLRQHFHFLTSIFGREFICTPGREDKQFDETMKSLKRLKFFEFHECNEIVEACREKQMEIAMLDNFLKPFLLGYWLVFDVIRAENKKVLVVYDEKWLIRLVQNRFVEIVEHDSVRNRYSLLSTDLIKNAFHVLMDLKVVRKENKQEYVVDISELLKIEERLGELLEAIPPRKYVQAKL